MDSFKNSSPDNTKTKENVDASINQSPDNIKMVNHIDITNNAETAVNKTPAELEQDKLDAEKAKQLEIKDSQATINIKMAGKEVVENATEKNIKEALSNPEKAKSLIAHLNTVGKLIEKLGKEFLDKADAGVEAFTKQIEELYKKIQEDKVEAGLNTVAVVGVLLAFKGMFEAVGINGGETTYIPPEKAAAFAKAMATVAVGFSTFVASINVKAARNGFFKGFFKGSK